MSSKLKLFARHSHRPHRKPSKSRIAASKTKPARPDIDVVMERIGKFKRAFEGRDTNSLEQVSESSDQRKAFVAALFAFCT